MLKYMEIAIDIRDKILQEVYKPNEQLPFEKVLGEQYSASKMTVKKALDILVSEGLIIKRRGSGTFVKDVQVSDIQKIILSNQFQGLTNSYYKKKVSSIIIDFKVIPATKEISQNLKIEEDTFVYKIIRVRLIDDSPAVIEETYMPISIIPNLKKSILEGSLYEYIQGDLGLKIQSSHRTIRVKKANEFQIKHLNLKEHDPVAESKQIAYLDNGQAFEYSISTHSHLYFEFETVIIR